MILQKGVFAKKWFEAAILPVGPIQTVRAMLRHVALSGLGALRQPGEGNYVRCFYCHYVFDDQVEHFEAIIRQLMTIGTFIDTATCMSMLEGRIPVDKKYFHLSFDDGFRNVFRNAVPTLVRHQVPALIFVPTSFIGADWEQAKEFCTNIAHYNAVIEMMDWKDLQLLAQMGFDIGSHTRTHVRFSAMAGNRAVFDREIAGSKSDIERNLGIECKYMSWPFGTLADADEPSLRFVEEAGYRACFGAFRGTVLPRQTNRYMIPRHHFEAQWPPAHVRYFACRKS